MSTGTFPAEACKLRPITAADEVLFALSSTAESDDLRTTVAKVAGFAAGVGTAATDALLVTTTVLAVCFFSSTPGWTKSKSD